jgi:hypothetical protein
MNKGDKVVCIKDFSLYDQKFIKGKLYQITQIYTELPCCYISGEIYHNNLNFGYTFHFETENNKPNFNKKFSEYFITLAEWRDKQIDKILDEAD